MGRKPSTGGGTRKPNSREITVPPSARSKRSSGESLGNGGRGPTAKVPALDLSSGDVPLIGMDEVEELTPSGKTRTEMTPLLPDPDDEGSEPKTAIDEQLFLPSPPHDPHETDPLPVHV